MKEFDQKICNYNWYKLFKEAQPAAKKTDKILKPYKIFAQPGGGQEEFLGRTLAFSALQARLSLIEGWAEDKALVDKVRSRRELGIEIVALLDAETWAKMQRERAEAEKAEQAKKQRKEKQVQEMWWNKD